MYRLTSKENSLSAPSPDSDPIEALAARFGVTPIDAELWWQALTHPSYANEVPGSKHYERLEFLGDAILGALVADELYRRRPDAPPGELTFLRSVLIRRETLADWAEGVGLRDLVRVGRSARGFDAVGWRTVLADVFEALLGVIWLEHGLEPVQAFVRKTVVDRIPSYADARRELEPKNVLQERLASDGSEVAYRVVHQDEHGVTVTVSWPGGEASATARSKREAAVEAARRALDAIDAESGAGAHA
ncbi:MAG: ribonuclease III [Candidatus Dadabacteria bacterium]|nr:MAG: ribonuclease III [Candidatus Dadabacteria bacterium]